MGSNVMAVFLDEYLFMNPKAFPSIFPTTATGMQPRRERATAVRVPQ